MLHPSLFVEWSRRADSVRNESIKYFRPGSPSQSSDSVVWQIGTCRQVATEIEGGWSPCAHLLTNGSLS